METDPLNTSLFLDSGDPADTRRAVSLIGKLHGQTTNPTLITKSSLLQNYISSGKTINRTILNQIYKDIVQEIASIIPQGSISIEVYADSQSTKEQLLEQAYEMSSWTSNAFIKFPTFLPGLEAAQSFVSGGGKANLTLCFSQSQAAAIHLATAGAKAGSVYCSSFVGRLFDKKINGIDLLKHIVTLYRSVSSHVFLLAASFRNLQQIYAALAVNPNIITMPINLMEEWVDGGMLRPDENYQLLLDDLINSVAQESYELDQVDWRSLPIDNEMTRSGIEKFASDWNNLFASAD